MKERIQNFFITTLLKIMMLGLGIMAGVGGAFMFIHYLKSESSLEGFLVAEKIGFYILSLPIVLCHFLYLSGFLKRLGIEPKLKTWMQIFMFFVFFPLFNYLVVIILNVDLHFVPEYLSVEGKASLQIITFISYLVLSLTALTIRELLKGEDVKKNFSDTDGHFDD